MSRANDLADRPLGARPESAFNFESIVPLSEVVAQVFDVGPDSKKVKNTMQGLLNKLGSELNILRTVPLEDIEKVAGVSLKEAVRRVRTGELSIDAGYDGEFGTVKIFKPEERDHLMGQLTFFKEMPDLSKKTVKASATTKKTAKTKELSLDRKTDSKKQAESLLLFKTPSKQKVMEEFINNPLLGLDKDQQQAALCLKGPLLVVAGPGTGKTRTLVARIAHQIKTGSVAPKNILAISFTNQAALELSKRIKQIIPPYSSMPEVTTFHGFGFKLLREFGSFSNINIIDEEARVDIALDIIGKGAKKVHAEKLLNRISLAKQSSNPAEVTEGDKQFEEQFKAYNQKLSAKELMDLDDLVLKAYDLLKNDTELTGFITDKYKSICVDEYQDVNDVQAEMIKLIAPYGKNLMAIGDPDQSIYGFRGANPGHFMRFEETYKETRIVYLKTIYRFTDNILKVAKQIHSPVVNFKTAKIGLKVEILSCPTSKSEAEQIQVMLEQIIGGSSMFAIDSGRSDGIESDDIGFGDVAVLCRTKMQFKDIQEAFDRSGMPYMTIGEDEPHDPRSQKVALMTMHASKGREFKVVFVAGVERFLMPLDLENLKGCPREENRLLYVAVTRAKQLCIISYAQKRFFFKKSITSGRSEFIQNLPSDAIINKTPRLPAIKPKSTQLTLL
jgi:DNA helicase-2/ATP-dependent DNA helicase PcrA